MDRLTGSINMNQEQDWQKSTYKQSLSVSEQRDMFTELKYIEERELNMLQPEDAKLLLLMVELNVGDASDVMPLFYQKIKGEDKLKEFKNLQKKIELCITQILCDEKLINQIKTKYKTCLSDIKRSGETQEVKSNSIFKCLQEDINSLTNFSTTKLITQIIPLCVASIKRKPLSQQLNLLISQILPKVMERSQIIKEITQSSGSLARVYHIDQVSKSEQNKLVKFMKALKSLKDFEIYGEDFGEIENKFVLSLVKKLTEFTPSWQIWKQITNNLIQDPLFDFSSNAAYSTEIKKLIYSKIYDLQQFKHYNRIKIKAKSLKNRQRLDINKIISSVLETPDYRIQKILKNYLNNYELIKFFSHEKITSKRLSDFYKFMLQQCKDYFALYRKKNKSTDEMRFNLTIELRKFLLQIEVPFDSHQRIQELVFNEKRYDLLMEPLRTQQIEKLSTWIYKKMKDYYQAQFHSMSLIDETKQELLKIIIVELDIQQCSYSQVNQFIDNILASKKEINSNKSEYFTEAIMKKIRKRLQTCDKLKEYCFNTGIDYGLEKLAAQNILFHEIIVPNKIGGLYAPFVEKFVKDYIETPGQNTIKNANLCPSDQNKLSKQIPKNQKLKNYSKTMQQYLSNKKKLNLKLFLKKKFQKNNFDSQSVYNLLVKYGKLRFDGGELQVDNEQDQQLIQLAESIKNEPEDAQAIMQCFLSDQYNQFKYEFPKSIENRQKDLKEQLTKAMIDELPQNIKNFTQEKAKKALRDLENSQFNLQEANIGQNIKNYISKMPEYKQYIQARLVYQKNKDLIDSIRKEMHLKEIFQEQNFSKYSDQEKKALQKAFGENQSQFQEVTLKYLTSHDAQLLKKKLSDCQDSMEMEEQKVKVISKKEQQKKPQKIKSSISSPKVDSKKPISEIKGKLISAEEWKKKQLKPSLDDFVNNVNLLETVGNKLKQYQKRRQIFEQYNTKLCGLGKKLEQDVLAQLKKDEESTVVKKAAEVPFSEILADFQYGNATWEVKSAQQAFKDKYALKLQAKFVKYIKQLGIKPEELKKLRKIRQEIESVKKLIEEAPKE